MKQQQKILTALILVIALVASTVSPVFAADNLKFTDMFSEKSIRDAIGKPTGEILKSELESFKSLNISGIKLGYFDLSNLSYFPNLEKLELRLAPYCVCSNLSAIGSLPRLKSLKIIQEFPVDGIYNSQIKDLAFLSSLSQLQELYLDCPGLTDASGLQGLTKLQSLTINSSKLSDISSLSNLTEIKELNLERNAISSILALAKLKNLKALYIGHNPVSSFDAIPGLYEKLSNKDFTQAVDTNGNIKWEVISDDRVRFINKALEAQIRNVLNKQSGDLTQSDLDSITSFEYYAGSGYSEGSTVQVRDLTRLRNLENLEIREQKWSSIEDMSELSSLQKLKTLTLTDYSMTFDMCGDFDFSDIEKFTALETLKVYYYDIKNIEKITPLQQLQELVLVDYGKSDEAFDISPVCKLNKLSNLSFFTQYLSDLKPLSNLPKTIKTLGIGCIKVSKGNLPLLKNMENLQELSLVGKGISDISALSSMSKSVTKLCIGSSNIMDITPLGALTNLTELNLQNNYITNIAPLSRLTKLNKLLLSENPIKDYSPVSKYYNRLKEKDFKLLKTNDGAVIGKAYVSDYSVLLDGNKIPGYKVVRKDGTVVPAVFLLVKDIGSCGYKIQYYPNNKLYLIYDKETASVAVKPIKGLKAGTFSGNASFTSIGTNVDKKLGIPSIKINGMVAVPIVKDDPSPYNVRLYDVEKKEIIIESR